MLLIIFSKYLWVNQVDLSLSAFLFSLYDAHMQLPHHFHFQQISLSAPVYIYSAVSVLLKCIYSFTLQAHLSVKSKLSQSLTYAFYEQSLAFLIRVVSLPLFASVSTQIIWGYYFGSKHTRKLTHGWNEFKLQCK